MSENLESVNGLIERLIAKYPSSDAKFYEEVHQELAPLARALEEEINSLQLGIAHSADYIKDIEAENLKLNAQIKVIQDDIIANGLMIVSSIPSEEWVNKYCELGNVNPKGTQGTFTNDGYIEITLGERARREIVLMLSAAPIPEQLR